MTYRLTRRGFLKTIAAAGSASTIGITGCLTNKQTTISISHAGSLSYPFNQIETNYENNKGEIKIERESHGSVDAVRQVTELNKKFDIVGVADYTLLPNMMMPKYTDWFIRFARNEYTIAYTEESQYSEEIGPNNWFEILKRDDVRFGFSNPNADPAGYRSQMVIKLAEDYYGENNLYEELIGQNSNLEINEDNDKYILEMPQTSEIDVDSDKIMFRSKETDLLSGLEGGQIDYLFIYGSVATQHGHKKIDLPTEIDLSSVEYSDNYSKVGVNIAGGNTVFGKPIVYGLTIPNNANNPQEAAEVLKYILSDDGDEVMEKAGQPPINPVVTNDVGAVPEEISDFVTES